MVSDTPARIVFLDVEASSFEGYPIEIGWAVVDPRARRLLGSEAHLICPPPAWEAQTDVWDPLAVALHGLSPGYVRVHGKPPARVAARLMEVLGDPEVIAVSDAAEFDQRWVDQLLAAVGWPRPWPVLRPVAGLPGFEAAPAPAEARHRAESDALALANRFLAMAP